MNWFLRAKHWQIFILIFAVPFVIEIIAMATGIMLRSPQAILPFIFVAAIVAIGTQFGWFYYVGNALGQRLPANAGMNVRRFRNFAIIPAIYIVVFLLLFMIFFLFITQGGRPSPYVGLIFFVILPMHFFSIFCIFYCMWFIAKSLKMVERWNFVEVGDYIGDFFLVWFLLVGIWFIQPRVNRLFDTPAQQPQQMS